MVKDFNIETVSIDGKYSKYFWDYNYNKNATLSNCLANCTTLAYGVCIAAGLGAPVKQIRDARNWHKNLSDGWEAIDYSRKNVREGDILEWDENHVAVAIDGDTVISSWYTGDNGRAYYDDGSYSKRNFSSLKETNDWMISNYPYRFFHKCSIEQEIKSLGNAVPKYILRKVSKGDIPEKLDKIITLIEEIKKEV